MIADLISFVVSVLAWIVLILCLILIIGLLWYVFVHKKVESINRNFEIFRRDIYTKLRSCNRYTKSNKNELAQAFREISSLRDEISNLKRTRVESAYKRDDVRKNRSTQRISRDGNIPGDSTGPPSVAGNVVEGGAVEALSPVEKLVADFNLSIRDRSEKDAFEAAYNPRRLSVSNAIERQVDPGADPIFETDGSGSYWLVDVDDQLLLLPFPTVIAKDRHRESGALDVTFNCSDYPRGGLYEVQCLIAPAILEGSMGGKKWKLKSAGRMKLTSHS